MNVLARLLSLRLRAVATLTAVRGQRSPQYRLSRILLLLLAACARCAPIEAMADGVETFRWVFGNGQILPVGVNTNYVSSDLRVEKIPGTNETPYSIARLSLWWNGNNTAYSSSNYGCCLFNISGELGTTATPGIYNVYFSANYSGVDPLPNTNRVDLTNTITLVAVTNVTASTNHIAVGTNKVTLTALMTPVGRRAVGDLGRHGRRWQRFAHHGIVRGVHARFRRRDRHHHRHLRLQLRLVRHQRLCRHLRHR